MIWFCVCDDNYLFFNLVICHFDSEICNERSAASGHSSRVSSYIYQHLKLSSLKTWKAIYEMFQWKKNVICSERTCSWRTCRWRSWPRRSGGRTSRRWCASTFRRRAVPDCCWDASGTGPGSSGTSARPSRPRSPWHRRRPTCWAGIRPTGTGTGALCSWARLRHGRPEMRLDLYSSSSVTFEWQLQLIQC